jgi:hypothetical protein
MTNNDIQIHSVIVVFGYLECTHNAWMATFLSWVFIFGAINVDGGFITRDENERERERERISLKTIIIITIFLKTCRNYFLVIVGSRGARDFITIIIVPMQKNIFLFFLCLLASRYEMKFTNIENEMTFHHKLWVRLQ